jgi:phosphoribosylformylglycinamidine synthase subunit PurS
MPRFNIHVRVMPRPALLDPQGQTVQHALANLGFAQLHDVRVGKALTFSVDRSTAADAERDARAMCDKLLSNPVTEDYSVTVLKITE